MASNRDFTDRDRHGALGRLHQQAALAVDATGGAAEDHVALVEHVDRAAGERVDLVEAPREGVEAVAFEGADGFMPGRCRGADQVGGGGGVAGRGP